MNIADEMRNYINLLENIRPGIPLSRLLAQQEHVPYLPAVIERNESGQSWADSVADWETVPENVQTRLQTAYPNLGDLFLELSGGLVHQMKATHSFDGDSIAFAAESAEIATLIREFDYGRNVLNLQEFYLADDVQGQDIGKRVLAGTYETAKKLGVIKMVLEAMDVGTYVWAKAGFRPQSWDSVREDLIAMLKERKWAQQGSEQIMRYLDDPSPSAIWGLAWDETRTRSGIQIGKRLLGQHPSWWGEFIVGDAEQEAVLQKFLNSKSSGVHY